MSRAQRVVSTVVVLAALAAGLGSAAAQPRPDAALDGPMRPKTAAKPSAARDETPRRTGAWTRAPGAGSSWRAGDTTVTVSGTVTLETSGGSRR